MRLAVITWVLMMCAAAVAGEKVLTPEEEAQLNDIKRYALAFDRNRRRYEAGLDRINQYRKKVRISSMKLDQKFCMAAQAHADYLMGQGGNMSHQQKPGTPGFVGKEFSDRVGYFAGKGASFECVSMNPDPVQSVDGLIGSVYHRLPFLDPDNDRVGIGLANRISVLDFGRGSKRKSSMAVLFPANTMTGVPPFWKVNERPNPVEQFGSPEVVGYPISARYPVPVDFVSAKLSCAGQPEVPIYVLHRENDKTGFLKTDVFLLAKEAMKPMTRYTVELVVTIKGVKKTATWTFTTSSAKLPGNLRKRKK